MEFIISNIGISYIKYIELSLLIGLLIMLLLFPFFMWIEWKILCKKYGKETAREIWKRYR